MARELTQRLTALGRAHDLVRPLPGGQGEAALLGDLLTILLAPYDDLGAFSGRVRVAVERMGVGEAAATSLALVIHELATNSLKYGALSSATGTLDVTTKEAGEQLELIWMERGGPKVRSPPEPEGFGSKLVHRTVSKQLGGTIEYEWAAEGLIATLRLKRGKLST
jgi:two-component sensor histidine kinase